MQQQYVLFDLIELGPRLYSGIQSTVPMQNEVIPGLHASLNHVYQELVTQTCMLLDQPLDKYLTLVNQGHFPDMQRFDHIAFLQSPESYAKLRQAVCEFAVGLYHKVSKHVQLGNPMIETLPDAISLDRMILMVIYK